MCECGLGSRDWYAWFRLPIGCSCELAELSSDTRRTRFGPSMPSCLRAAFESSDGLARSMAGWAKRPS